MFKWFWTTFSLGAPDNSLSMSWFGDRPDGSIDESELLSLGWNQHSSVGHEDLRYFCSTVLLGDCGFRKCSLRCDLLQGLKQIPVSQIEESCHCTYMGRTLFSKAYTVLPYCRTQSFVDSGKWEVIAVLQQGEEGRLFQCRTLLYYIRLNRCYRGFSISAGKTQIPPQS